MGFRLWLLIKKKQTKNPEKLLSIPESQESRNLRAIQTNWKF